jgi:hypothetical protein
MKASDNFGMTVNSPRVDWKTERDRIDLAAVAMRLLGPSPSRGGACGGLWWRSPYG